MAEDERIVKDKERRMYQNPLTIEDKLKLLKSKNKGVVKRVVNSLADQLRQIMKQKMMRREEIFTRTNLQNKKRMIEIDD